MPEKRTGFRVPLTLNASAVMREGADSVIYIQHGREIYTLRGKDAQDVVKYILPRIDGYATSQEIVSVATQKGAVTASWAESVLRWMVDSGLCAEDREDPGDRALRRRFETQISHFGEHGSMPTACQKLLRDSRVVVIGLEYLGSVLVQHLAAAGIGRLRAVGNPRLTDAETPFLGAARSTRDGTSRHALLARRSRVLGFEAHYEGVETRPDGGLDWEGILADCDLAVLVLPRWIPSLIQSFNRAGLERGTPFLAVWFEEGWGYVGPLVIPYETACLFCLELRRRSHWTVEDFRERQGAQAEAGGPVWEDTRFLIPQVSAIASITACEIVTALSRYRQPVSRGRQIFIDFLDWEIQSAPVLKVPRCPDCGRARTTPSYQPFTLRPMEGQTDGSAD